MARIDVVGSGAWGTTLALLLAGKGLDVQLVCRLEKNADEIRRTGENSAHLAGVKLPPALEAICLSAYDASHSGHIVLAVPSQHMREVLSAPAFTSLYAGAEILHATKGLELYHNGGASCKRMSQVITESLRLDARQAGRIAVLSGPNIAREIAAGNYATTVIASKDSSAAAGWYGFFNFPGRFVPHLSDDIVGVEFGGALKNITAIACGMVDGLGMGANTKAVVFGKGLEEMTAFGVHYGARPGTFNGPSGLLDLAVTCNGSSRNRLVGERVAQGKPLQQVLAQFEAEKLGEPEGPVIARVVYEANGHLDLPVMKAVYDALFMGVSARLCLERLLGS